MKVITITILSFICFCTAGVAQNRMNEGHTLYQTAAGFRSGGSNAVSIKHFIYDDLAVEAYAGIRGFTSPTVGATLQKFKHGMFDQQKLGMFFGGGLHGGTTPDEVTINNTVTSTQVPNFGIDGIFGFEYDFTDLIDFPVAASIDVMAGADFLNFWIPFPQVTLGVRYIFKQ
jgi:hypothetical protein